MNQIDWEAGQKLIGYIVSRIGVRLPSHIEAEDLHSVGVIGLLDAANKFDANRNCKFSTYAEFRIKGAILDQLRSMDWVPRSTRQKARKLEQAYAEVEQTLGHAASGEEMANFLDLAADEFNALQNQAATRATVSLDEQLKNFDDAGTRGEAYADHRSENPFAALNQARTAGKIAEAVNALPEQERMIISLYYYEDLNMKETGLILGLSESRVCQIHTKATAALRIKLTN